MKLSPAARDSVCSSCHLEGDTSVEHIGRSVAEWKPGEDIAEVVTYFSLRTSGDPAGNSATDRSVSGDRAAAAEPLQTRERRPHVVHELP